MDQPPSQGTWRYSVGHVVEVRTLCFPNVVVRVRLTVAHFALHTQHMLRAQLFPACREALTLLCGPPAMVELALIPGLESLGYTADDLFEF